MKKVPVWILSLAATCAAGFTQSAVAGRDSGVPVLPTWPHQILANARFPDGDFLRAQLDGTGADELVVVTPDPTADSPKTQVIVYRWRERFVELCRASLVPQQQFVAPAVGDLDGDGHDEIYVASPRGRLAVLTLDNGHLRTAEHTIRSEPQVTGIAIAHTPSGTRLIAALGSDEFSQTPELAVLGKRGSEWTPSKRHRMKCDGMDFGFVPASGITEEPLFARHRPSGIDKITYSRLSLSKSGLNEAERSTGGPVPPRGMEWWVGVSSKLIRGSTTLLSETSYLLPDGHTISRGELLEARPSVVVKRFMLPGTPLVTGEFRRPGEPVVLIRREASTIQVIRSSPKRQKVDSARL